MVVSLSPSGLIFVKFWLECLLQISLLELSPHQNHHHLLHHHHLRHHLLHQQDVLLFSMEHCDESQNASQVYLGLTHPPPPRHLLTLHVPPKCHAPICPGHDPHHNHKDHWCHFCTSSYFRTSQGNRHCIGIFQVASVTVIGLPSQLWRWEVLWIRKARGKEANFMKIGGKA